jgi:hypothetical protein
MRKYTDTLEMFIQAIRAQSSGLMRTTDNYFNMKTERNKLFKLLIKSDFTRVNNVIIDIQHHFFYKKVRMT